MVIVAMVVVVMVIVGIGLVVMVIVSMVLFTMVMVAMEIYYMVSSPAGSMSYCLSSVRVRTTQRCW